MQSASTTDSTSIADTPAHQRDQRPNRSGGCWRRVILIVFVATLLGVAGAVLWARRETTPNACLWVGLPQTAPPTTTMYRVFDLNTNAYVDHSIAPPVQQGGVSTADGKYMAYFSQTGRSDTDNAPVFSLVVAPKADGVPTDEDHCYIDTDVSCLRVPNSPRQTALPIDPQANVLGRMEQYQNYDIKRAKSQPMIAYTWDAVDAAPVLGSYNAATGQRHQPPALNVPPGSSVHIIGWYLNDQWLFFATNNTIYGWSLADNHLVSITPDWMQDLDSFDQMIQFASAGNFMSVRSLHDPTLQIVNLKTGDQAEFTAPDNSELLGTWSPDGRFLLVSATGPGNGVRVYVVQPNGQGTLVLQSKAQQTMDLPAHIAGSQAYFVITTDDAQNVLVHLDLTTLKTDILEKNILDLQEIIEANGRRWYVVLFQQPDGLQVDVVSGDLAQQHTIAQYDADQHSRDRNLEVTADQSAVIIEGFQDQKLTLNVLHAGADHADLLAANVVVPTENNNSPYEVTDSGAALLYQAVVAPDSTNGGELSDLVKVTLTGQSTTVERNVVNLEWLLGFDSDQIYATGQSPAMQLEYLNTRTGTHRVLVTGMSASPQFYSYPTKLLVVWHDASGWLWYGEFGSGWQLLYTLVSPIQDVNSTASEVLQASPDNRWVVMEQEHQDRTTIITLNNTVSHSSTTLFDRVANADNMVAAWTPDSRYLALMSLQQTQVLVFDMDGPSVGTPVQTLPLPSDITDLKWGCGVP